MPKLHTALVTETYAPEINGVAMTLSRWVEGLTVLGHSVELWRPQPADATVPYVNGTVTEHRVRGFALPMYPELRIGQPATQRMAGAWRSRRPDVIYVATEGPLGWSALRAARRAGIPVISGFHTRFDQYSRHYRLGLLSPLVEGYLRRFHRATQVTLAPTPQLRSTLQQAGFGRVAVIPRGVNTALFDPSRHSVRLRAEWGAADAALVLLCVGRIAKEKNLEAVIAAYRTIQTDRPDTRLVLVGDGPQRAALARTHPDIIFAGVQRGVPLAEHYASADLFLFASRTETFGNVTLEAMASGLPVVAYDYAAAAMHIRDGETGLHVPFDEGTPCFVDTARTLSMDADLRARLAGAARTHARQISWDRVLLELEALLIRCAQPPHS